MSSHSAIADQVAMLREEIEDLDTQVAAGDLDAATAGTLRERYTTELDVLLAETNGEEGTATSRAVRRSVSGRSLAGAAMVGIAILAIGAFAVASMDSPTSSGAEGVAGDVLSGAEDVDLSTVTNEQMEEVVAGNPDVIGMRLALARRYFEEGTFDKALDHYFEVLDRERNAEALANIGWMTYLSGRPDVALGYLEKSLEVRLDYLPAQWFIANVYVSLNRPAEAAILLIDLAQSDNVPQEIRDGAVTLLEQIEGSS